jgi:hypothetical protein
MGATAPSAHMPGNPRRRAQPAGLLAPPPWGWLASRQARNELRSRARCDSGWDPAGCNYRCPEGGLWPTRASGLMWTASSSGGGIGCLRRSPGAPTTVVHGRRRVCVRAAAPRHKHQWWIDQWCRRHPTTHGNQRHHCAATAMPADQAATAASRLTPVGKFVRVHGVACSEGQRDPSGQVEINARVTALGAGCGR